VGFAPGATVLIGGRAAPLVEWLDANTLSAVTPAGSPGRVDIFVSSRDGVARYPAGFRYDGGPRIDVITPAGGPLAGGYPVTIEGAGFHAPLTVRLGSRALEDLVILADGRLTGRVPAAPTPGAVDIVVASETGAAT